MSRIKAAFTATAIAEYYRDQGLNVLLMIDSITRVAMAQRELAWLRVNHQQVKVIHLVYSVCCQNWKGLVN